MRTIQENSAAIVRSSGWTSRTTAVALAGKHMTAATKGVKASMTFRGTGFTYNWVATPASGRVYVYVDGTLAGTLDQYASSATRRSWTKTGLADKLHSVTFVVAGTRQAASSGFLASVDQVYVR
jgi:hypothetical protein